MVVVVGEEDEERRTSHDAWSWRNRWQDGRCVEGHVITYRFRALGQDTVKLAWWIYGMFSRIILRGRYKFEVFGLS